jgi:GAF domain-containing protein
VRSSVHTAAIPVIALAEPGPQKQALLAGGVEACLDLPFDVTEVIAALEAHMNVGAAAKGPPAEILNDPDRLAALDRTGMLDSEPDEDLDIVTRLAARLLSTPVAIVSLVDDKRQFFKSQIGLPEPWDARRQTPLSHSFCQWVVSSDQELVVADARVHPVLRANGAVSDLGVVAYAGVPLLAVTGETIGSFCAIDGKPRAWNAGELATLRDLGQIVDAYSALAQTRTSPAESDATGVQFRTTARAAAKGFVGAARLLQRHGAMAEERATLVGIVDRHGHQLTAIADTLGSLRAAA